VRYGFVTRERPWSEAAPSAVGDGKWGNGGLEQIDGEEKQNKQNIVSKSAHKRSHPAFKLHPLSTRLKGLA
jgi:hypothetical protein